jgi:hypothetical protein
MHNISVMTLTLSSQPKQKHGKTEAKNATWETHLHSRDYEGMCEGMNPHTLKWTPTLGVGIHMESQIFIERFQKLKLIGMKTFLYHYKALEM